MYAANTRRLVSAIVAITALTATVPVLAEPATMMARISVSADDIDLASPAGVQKLRARVDSTIRRACAPVEFGGAIDYGTHEQTRALDECRTNAQAAAEPQLLRLIAAGNPRIASN